MSNTKQPNIAVRINLKAQPGKEESLANLLSTAAATVKETEPDTLYWYSIKLSEDTFAICDGFADEEGLNAHFNGQVAAALKQYAAELVVGGWDQGVLPNIEKSAILSSIN